MSRRLIILGASVRAAAFSAIRAGFEPYAIDCYADRDLAAVGPAIKIERYPHDFEAALSAAPPAPWIYTGGLENYPRLIERLAALRPLWGNAGAGLRNVRRPSQLAAAAREAGLTFPRMQSTVQTQERPARWLVKRRRSSGGLGVRFAMENERFTLSRGSYFQEYIEGQAASAVYVAASGRAVLLGATSQLLGRDVEMRDRPFLYAGSIGPLTLNEDETARLQSLGSLLATKFRLLGLFGIDFLRAENRLWLIEVNPRYTASIEVLERATTSSFLAIHAAACEHSDLPDQPLLTTTRFCGKQVVYASKNSTISHAFDQLVTQLNRPGQPPLIADLPHLGDPLTAGQPVATVFIEDNSPADVIATLSTRSASVEEVLSTE
jgi:predicted ATP-grasp superfamily ATP-dependent carboligase